MTPSTYKINEENNVIDDHALDLLGATFNFDHVKGLAEWLKNSVDVYIRIGTPDRDQRVIFRFTDGSTSAPAVIECIDFGGMTAEDIDKALKRWGDPEASKRGVRNLKTYGGHGNGGKFYMRQMFDTSEYITYKNGKLNIFGFNINKKYGFAEGFRDKVMNPADALKLAGLDKSYVPAECKADVLAGKIGFTVVKGVAPHTMPNHIKTSYICTRLINHPQAQRILSRIPAAVVANEKVLYDRLAPERLEPLPGFESLAPISIPATLVHKGPHGEETVEMQSAKFPAGKLQLFTSSIAMEPGSKLGELNRIDVIGEIGVLGSYKLKELGTATYIPQSVFVYGEVECPILEDPDLDSVHNDRAKLIENPRTTALLAWVDDQVRELCQEIAKQQRTEQEQELKDLSSSLNNFLNQWKDKYMSRILADILTSPGAGPGAGAGSEGASATDTKAGGDEGRGPVFGGGHQVDPTREPGTGGFPPSGPSQGADPTAADDEKDGGGANKKKANRSPRVLLSDHDPDPFDPSHSITLSDRQPAVYQRPQDVDEGIYWINTSSPLAKSILERYKKGPRWRDYLFQRYVDIFIKEALLKLEKRDPDDFNAANVERTIGEVVQKIHAAASSELKDFLFEEVFDPETKA